MATVDITPRFGAELKDSFKTVNAWISNGINWLDDIQQFYEDRAAIEKEYSAKLSALAKKNFEKKAKRTSPLSVGDTPALTPGSLESASLTTWTTQLSTLEARAAEHLKLSNDLIAYISNPLKNVASRYEDVRKSHVEYAAKLEKERDSVYSELKKSKGRYDGACQEVENRRKKTESAFDYSKGKNQNAYQQQLMEMHNVKNTYLISINITNKQKERYYHEYVPELLDSLQDLSETRVSQINKMWSHAANLETTALTRSTEHMQNLSSEIPRNDPRLDSLMFVKHNVAPWQEPADFMFEPSPVWLDDGGMVTDETAKVFLRNVLGKSKIQLRELKAEVDRKAKEVDGVRRIRQNAREGKDKRDEVDLVKALFSMMEALHQVERQRSSAEVEVLSITSAVGDVSLGAQNHRFKSQTFKVPTNCDLCGERIWGLSAKGFDCQDCGYTCHSKCELKVPAECPGEVPKDERKKLKVERQAAAKVTPVVQQPNGGRSTSAAELPGLDRSDTMDTLSSGYAASAQRSVSGRSAPEEGAADAAAATNKPAIGGAGRRNRVVAPPPAQYVSELPVDGASAGRSSTTSAPSETRGKMLYAYTATADGELSIDEDDEVTVTEADDGSGWTSVLHPRLGSGLVPTSYLEISPPSTATASSTTIISSRPDRPTSAYSNSSTSVTGSTSAGGGGALAAAAAAGIAASKKKGPAVAPKRGARKLKQVEAMYDYEARSEGEWSFAEGEKFVLVVADQGDGWAEVERGGVTKSVPAAYVREI